MKRVLIITNHSYMFWQFRRDLVAAMVSQGHRVILAVPFGDRVEELKALGCELIDTPMNRRGTSPLQELALMRLYRDIITRAAPDIVVTYSIKPNIYAGSICARRGIPYCVNIQGAGAAFQNPAFAAVITGFYRAALKKARVVFFENEENARMFRERGITPAEKQSLLRGAGVNLEHYAYRPYPENEPFRFLYVGRLMREKGMNELFEAVQRLHREGERFHLDIVGFFEEHYDEQVAQLEKLGICTFHGFQMETRPFYASADCIVMPSYHEGMSNVLLEGAAVGRPLITCDIPGCREAVADGLSGLTCPVQNADALHSAMKKVLRLPRAEREAMGRAGRERMQAWFDKQKVVEKTLEAIFKEAAHEAVR